MSVCTWEMGALGMQQDITLHMMNKMVRVAMVVEESGCAQQVKEKAVEEDSAVSGGHGVQEADASEVESDGTGNALGKPASPAEAPSAQAEACDSSCGSAADLIEQFSTTRCLSFR